MTTSANGQTQSIPPSPIDLDRQQTPNVTAEATATPARTPETGSQSFTDVITQRLAGGASANRNRTQFIDLAVSRGRSFTHVPNILDSFANYTYHIRWSITDDIVGSSINSVAEFQSVPKVVIAESGMTAGFNIVDFEIENLCAPGPRIQAMLHTSIKMTIKEPYGLSLIDRIYSVSRQMGVKNHLTSSCFIEIWFTGYNEDGTDATRLMKSSIYKLFRVNITKFESDTKSDGTEYRIEAIIDNMYANADHVAISAHAAQIEGALTVGDFFRVLQNVLNEQQRNLTYDFTRRIEYVFRVPRWMADWRFSRDLTTNQRNGDISVNQSPNLATPTFTISRGMDISTILYFVISMTEDGKNYVAGENRRANQSGAAQQGRSRASIAANGMANILAIHSRSQIIGFDYLTGDYIRRITYTFTEYPTARAMIDQTNVRSAQQPAQQADRRSTLLASRRYIKSYDYIFTGKNLDILKLEIKLDWFWQSAIPSQLGENHYSNFTVGPRQDQNGVATNILNEYRSARARQVRAQAEIDRLERLIRPGSTTAERTAAEQQLPGARAALEQATTEVNRFGTNARQFQEIWDDSSTGDRAVQNILAGESIRNDVAFQANQALRQNWSQATQNRRTAYLEDINVVDVYSTPLPISFRPNPSPISQRTDVGGTGAPERHSAQHSPSNLPRNRSLVAAVLNDVMTTPYFAEVELELRGDPYWLGLGNITENTLIDAVTNGTANGAEFNNDGAWFYNGETGFFLTFRTGEAPNESTGYVDFSSYSIAFTGLYNVHTVKSTFRDGKFSQVLKAIRDPLLNPDAATQAPASGLPISGATANMEPGNPSAPPALSSGADARPIAPATPQPTTPPTP